MQEHFDFLCRYHQNQHFCNMLPPLLPRLVGRRLVPASIRSLQWSGLATTIAAPQRQFGLPRTPLLGAARQLSTQDTPPFAASLSAASESLNLSRKSIVRLCNLANGGFDPSVLHKDMRIIAEIILLQSHAIAAHKKFIGRKYESYARITISFNYLIAFCSAVQVAAWSYSLYIIHCKEGTNIPVESKNSAKSNVERLEELRKQAEELGL
jgi:hypothetical protein